MTSLGLDTSNYTTSAAMYTPPLDRLVQEKQLLPVKEGQMGLRQSDALFHHVRQLPEVMERLRMSCNAPIDCIGASDRPGQVDGSYMPCFLAGVGAARELAAVLGVPLHVFTHQQGHVAAALYGTGHLAWMEKPFLAFHVSGGTTDALLVEPHDTDLIRCRVAAHSRDLKAGQLIDRVGGMLGLRFPAGPALDRLAQTASGTYKPRVAMNGADCHLSGVQNQCEQMHKAGAPDEEVALFCLKSIESALVSMTQALLSTYGDLPLLYAGGVMSNTLLKRTLTAQFGGAFADPIYSADNAAGIAVLTAIRQSGDMPR